MIKKKRVYIFFLQNFYLYDCITSGKNQRKYKNVLYIFGKKILKFLYTETFILCFGCQCAYLQILYNRFFFLPRMTFNFVSLLEKFYLKQNFREKPIYYCHDNFQKTLFIFFLVITLYKVGFRIFVYEKKSL